jgi:hypothetical protein
MLDKPPALTPDTGSWGFRPAIFNFLAEQRRTAGYPRLRDLGLVSLRSRSASLCRWCSCAASGGERHSGGRRASRGWSWQRTTMARKNRAAAERRHTARVISLDGADAAWHDKPYSPAVYAPRFATGDVRPLDAILGFPRARRPDCANGGLPDAARSRRLELRDSVYTAARREMVDSLSKELKGGPLRYLELVRLDNASLMGRRVYAADLNLFDAILREEGGVRAAVGRIIALARKAPRRSARPDQAAVVSYWRPGCWGVRRESLLRPGETRPLVCKDGTEGTSLLDHREEHNRRRRHPHVSTIFPVSRLGRSSCPHARGAGTHTCRFGSSAVRRVCHRANEGRKRRQGERLRER